MTFGVHVNAFLLGRCLGVDTCVIMYAYAKIQQITPNSFPELLYQFVFSLAVYETLLQSHQYLALLNVFVKLFIHGNNFQSTEFSRPEYWSGQPFPSPGDLPNPGIESRSPTLQVDSLPAEPQTKPKIICKDIYSTSLIIGNRQPFLKHQEKS